MKRIIRISATCFKIIGVYSNILNNLTGIPKKIIYEYRSRS